MPVHLLEVNEDGAISKAYENDDVLFPADALGAVEGRTVCRFRSSCPDERCCRTPPASLSRRWRTGALPSPRVHSSLFATMPTGAFPGVDEREVDEFLELHAAS